MLDKAPGRPIEAWMKAFPPVKEMSLKIVSVEGRRDASWKIAHDIFNSDLPAGH